MIGDALNKGIPSAAICSISNMDIIKMSNNPEKTEKLLIEQFKIYKKEAEKLVEDDFGLFRTKALCTHVDFGTTNNVISFSPFFIYTPMIMLLELNKGLKTNLKEKSIVSVDLEHFNFDKKIKELEKINNERQLKRKFPKIHMFYDGNKKDFQTVKNFLNKHPDKRDLLMKKLEDDGRDYEEMRKTTDISYFIGKIINTFNLIGEKSEELKMQALDFVLPMECFEDIDEEKLSLYLACQYLEQSSYSPNKQDYLYYTASYFNEDPSRKTNNELKITYGYSEDGQYHFMTTPKEVYDKFKNVLAYFPELNFLDIDRREFAGMGLVEVEEYLNKYLEELNVNWDFLSPDDNSISKEYIEAIQSDKRDSSKIDKEKLLELYIEKKELFDSSSPYLIIRGKNSFDGYRGYLYENGSVVLEKFFDNYETKRIATGQAIYVMDLSNFYELSKKSKTEIIMNNLCDRITHRGNWQERVLAAINKDKEIDLELELSKIKNISK